MFVEVFESNVILQRIWVWSMTPDP